jgi:PleD family two-component response regulator
VRLVVQASVHPIAGSVTLSAGIASWDGRTSIEDAIARADRALYRAKGLGRDRVETTS